MRKPTDVDSLVTPSGSLPHEIRSLGAPARAGASGGSAGIGSVHCFVGEEELHRLLSIMAGVELIGVMLGDWLGG